MPAPTYPLYFTGSSGTEFSDPVPTGDFVVDYPFGERNPTALTFRQRFIQLREEYERPSPNAQNCDADPQARFINDEAFADVGMGLMTWTRLWATIPTPITDYEPYSYTFPGYAATLSVYGRVPLTNTVTSKLVYDFFLVGPGGSRDTAGDIPVYFGQTYTYGPSSGSQAAEYLSADSLPTITTYKGWVSTDAATPASYSIEAHDSILDLYLGNIWRRTRRFIKAR